MAKQEMVPKPANPKFNMAAKSHRACLDQLIEADRLYSEASVQLREMESRLEATFDEARATKKELEESKEKWRSEKYDLQARVKQLEEELKSERRRAHQALDVAERTSEAAGGIGRLLHVLVNNEVLEELRLSAHDRRTEAKERMRHRSPG